MNDTSFVDSSHIELTPEGGMAQRQTFCRIEEIPSIGFNQIFRAEKYGKKWLLKGLKKEFRNQPFYLELLKKELDISLSLDHPNIVKTFGLEQLPETGPCIVMEYVDGDTLKKAIEKEISPSSKLRIVYQLLEAVSYFHSKQIVHRDLKPANIIITHNGNNVKVIDFGLADTDAYFILKQPAGTNRYVSPEQQAGGYPNVKNDIYSIGRILEDLHLGRRYHGVVQKCLVPAANRYENISQVVAALHKSDERPMKRIYIGIMVLLMSLLCYITWQVTSIQNSIPSSPVDSPTETVANELQPPAFYPPGTRNKAMDQAIRVGIDQVDDYVQSTQIQQHLDTLSNIKNLDNIKLTNAVMQINHLINEYCSEIRKDFNDRQRSDIYYYICYHITETYFNKWNAKILSFSMKYQEPYSQQHQ